MFTIGQAIFTITPQKWVIVNKCILSGDFLSKCIIWHHFMLYIFFLTEFLLKISESMNIGDAFFLFLFVFLQRGYMNEVSICIKITSEIHVYKYPPILEYKG